MGVESILVVPLLFLYLLKKIFLFKKSLSFFPLILRTFITCLLRSFLDHNRMSSPHILIFLFWRISDASSVHRYRSVFWKCTQGPHLPCEWNYAGVPPTLAQGCDLSNWIIIPDLSKLFTASQSKVWESLHFPASFGKALTMRSTHMRIGKWESCSSAIGAIVRSKGTTARAFQIASWARFEHSSAKEQV